MGGERDMARLLEPKADYPVLVQKPVAKLFQKLYLDRIEGTYKTGSYEKYNLQAYVASSSLGPILIPCCPLY